MVLLVNSLFMALLYCRGWYCCYPWCDIFECDCLRYIIVVVVFGVLFVVVVVVVILVCSDVVHVVTVCVITFMLLTYIL